MLEVQDLEKYYGPKALYGGLSCKVEGGDRVVVAGPTGSGKTTLLKIILGLESPSRGKVLFFGRDVHRLAPRSRAYLRRNMGIVFQDFRLIGHWSVYQNIALGLQVRGERNIREKVESIARSLHLEDFLKLKASRLSGGQQQLVAVARVAVMEPLLVLADEPLSNLDPGAGDRVLEALMDLNERGAALIVATHNAELSRKIKARVIELRSDSGD